MEKQQIDQSERPQGQQLPSTQQQFGPIKSLPFRYYNHHYHHHDYQMLTSSLSRRRKSRPLRGSPAIAIIYIIINTIFRLSIYSIILLPNLGAAHSNINSVWLSKEDASEIHHRHPGSSSSSNLQIRANNQTAGAPIPLPSPLTTRLFTERSGDSRLQLTPNSNRFLTGKINPTIQASPSSLQPTIAVLDSNDENSISERRIDSVAAANQYGANRAFPFNSSAYGAFTDEASSLDHLWSVNQTNAQVQFDEEHLDARSNGVVSKINFGPVVVGVKTNSDRRQDNETSTLAPQHDVPTQTMASTSTEQANLGAIGSAAAAAAGATESPMEDGQFEYDKRNQNNQEASKSSQPMNYFMGELNVDNNQETDLKRNLTASNMSLENSENFGNNNNNNNSNNKSSSSFIYYRPEANNNNNKWSPTGVNIPDDTASLDTNNQDGEHQHSSSRRKLHNTGTQYDLNELGRILVASQEESNAASYTKAPSNNRPDLLGPSGFAGGGSSQGNRKILKASNFGGQEVSGINGNGMEDHRGDNFPSYYYTGGGVGQAHSDKGQRHNDRPHWRQPNSNYNQLMTQTSGTTTVQRTTPMPTTFATTISPQIYMSSPRPTPVPDFHMITANLNRPNTKRLAAPQSVLRPSVVKHPSNRPLVFGRHYPVPGEQLLVNNRRDISGAWRQRPPSSRSRLQPPSLNLGQRAPLLVGYSPAYGPRIINRYKHYGQPTSNQAGGRNNNFKAQNYKPKKSILGSLGSKLNSWVDPNPGREQKLEESFYETSSHQHRRRVRPPANWRTANNLYYIHAPQAALASVLDPTRVLGSGPADYQLAQPTITSQLYPAAGPSSMANQDQLFRSTAINYYPTLYYGAPQSSNPQASYLSGGGGDHYLFSPLAVRQPTVAPVPSSLNKFFYSSGEPNSLHHLHPTHLHRGMKSHRKFPNTPLESHLTQSSHHMSQYVPHRTSGSPENSGQQPANFIPVVAVSVTKTSPAPKPMNQIDDSFPNTDQLSEQPLNSELIDYLEMKTGDGRSYTATGNRNRNNNNHHHHHHRGTSSLAGGTNQFHRDQGNNDINMVRAQLDDYGNLGSGTISRDAAAFRRYPPTEDSSGIGSKLSTGRAQQQNEHTTTVKSAIFGYLPHEADKPLMHAINMLPHNQAQREKLSPFGDGDPYIGQLSDTSHTVWNQHIPPRGHHDGSNDLVAIDEPPSLGLQLQANSFVQNDIAHPFTSDSPSSRSKPYTSGLQSLLNQQQQHQQQQQQQQQVASRFKNGANPLGNPSIDVYPTSQHQYHGFQFVQPAESSFVSPHHLNPLLSAGDGIRQPYQPAILTAAATEVNPLAPATVMFAASPGYALHPAGSEHLDGQQSASPDGGGGSGGGDDNDDDDESGQSQLNKGNKKRSSDFFASAGQLLLSALPLLLAPTLGLMFASSPLPVARYQAPSNFGGSANSMHSSIPGEYLNSLNVEGHVSNGAPQIFTPSPPGYNLTTTSRPRQPQQPSNNSNTLAMAASKPVPTIIKNKTTPIPQKLTVTLTTLGPPVFVNETALADELPVEIPASNTKVQSIDHHHHHHHVGNTILLLTDEDTDRTQLDGLNTTDFKSLIGNHTIHDIGGYEGVDYDAQFANLKKHSHSSHHKNPQPLSAGSDNSSSSSISSSGYLDTRAQNTHPHSIGTNSDKSPSNDHHYLDGPTAESSPDPERPPRIASGKPTPSEVDDDVSTKLYPVLTWPPMRRRTVSLVTSNGNKTLLDASEKYQTIDYYTNQQQSSSGNNNNGGNSGNYTTTFDDFVDEPEIGGYNSSLRGSAARKVSGPNSDSNQDSSKFQHDALDFMFSDGHSTVSLIREPLASRLSKVNNNQSNRTSTRNKRETIREKLEMGEVVRHNLANNTSTNHIIQPDGRPVRVVKRVVRLKLAPNATLAGVRDDDDKMRLPSSRVNNGSSLIESASSVDISSGAQEEGGSFIDNTRSETMKIDSSKSKSAHIVATMIARLDDDDGEIIGKQQQVGMQQPSDEYYQPTAHDNDDLREQLERKKAQLAQISGNDGNLFVRARPTVEQARNQGPPPPVRLIGMQQLDESRQRFLGGGGDDDLPPIRGKFSNGGRGHIPPAPIEVTPVIKIKLYGNDSAKDRHNRQESHASAARTPPSRLDLSEETKRALANFGTLMIKDSVQMHEPPVEDDTRIGRGNNRIDKQVRRWRNEATLDNYSRNDRVRAPSHRVRAEHYETPLDGVATERSFTRSTASPDGVAFNPDDNYLDMRDVPNDQPKRAAASRPQQQQQQPRFKDEPRSRRRPVANRGDDYFYNYNDDSRPTRAPAYQQQQQQQHHVRDRVNLFDSDAPSSFGASSSDNKPADDYQNGQGYMGQMPDSGRSYQMETDRSSDYQQANRANRWGDERRSNYSTNTDRRSEPSSPGGVHQYGYNNASRSDPSLQQPHGYVYDLRNNPPDPLPTHYSGPTQAPLRDIQPYHPFNVTTYAPNLYVPNQQPNNRPHHHQQQQQHYSIPHDENHYPSVPNGHNRQLEYPAGPTSSQNSPYSSQYNQAPIAHHHHHHHQQQQQQQQHTHSKYHGHPPDVRYPASSDIYQHETYHNSPVKYPARNSGYQAEPSSSSLPYSQQPSAAMMQHGAPLVMSSSQELGDSRGSNDYLKRVQFSDSDRDKLMASYLTCDGLLNDNDHCLERLSCEFSDPQNIEKANKLDRAVSSIPPKQQVYTFESNKLTNKATLSRRKINTTKMSHDNQHSHWGYSRPDEWARLYPIGRHQSPINILVNNYEQMIQSTCCNEENTNAMLSPNSANNNHHHHHHHHHNHHHGHHILSERMASLYLNNGNKSGNLKSRVVEQRRIHLDSVGDDQHPRSSSTCSSASGSSCPPSPAQNYEDSGSYDSTPFVAQSDQLISGDQQQLQVQRTRYCTSSHKIFLGYPRYLSSMQLCNTGHSWQVTLPAELTSHTLLSGPPLGDREYRLAQLHCHWGEDLEHGSEHLINGCGFAAEIHFVHWNCTDFSSMEEASRHKNGLAVLGVMVQALEGEHNRNKHLDKIANALKRIEKPGTKVDINARLDLKKLFPANRWNYASYEGSLTTPPLSEVVDWVVFLNPIQCSASQIEQFRKLRCPSEDCNEAGQKKEQKLTKNFRPVQPHNGRLVSIWSHHSSFNSD